ncbi:MAG: heparinase [Bacteroidetes bacterium HGW-Bacteroidetes-8]|jgi:hypothetical protein|nr:MAG: heparinase [Bacteroidetes bacterium HGW-Bacteroidetes-8]
MLDKIYTIFRLGIVNVLYVIWYRVSLKIGFRKLSFKRRNFIITDDFFSVEYIPNLLGDNDRITLFADADKIVSGHFRYYNYHWIQVGDVPNWFANPFIGRSYPNANKHWTELADFDLIAGDIKNIWEASRFKWVMTLSRAYAASGEKKYIERLNFLLKDWSINNPFNIGPNWKCGQEASIRIFNLLNSLQFLGQHLKPSESICQFVYYSLDRISRNIFYAIAQNNNHGTSESAALYIGGLWLNSIDSVKYPRALTYSKSGRYWLENRVNKLISHSGSFSQHSVNYHRLLLDTLSYCEFWRNKLNDKRFSNQFYKKSLAATHWLWRVTDEISGDAPNLGSNDGALLYNLISFGYRDFRPSLAFANELFGAGVSFDGVKAIDKLNSDGYTTLIGDNSWALVKWPFYKFRPSHSDALHFDLWYMGRNILCDCGTYSYNPVRDFGVSLSSVGFHNTVSFDGFDQMPLISRFLKGGWLNTSYVSSISTSEGGYKWSCSYKDNRGNIHIREIKVIEDTWIITDNLSGNFKSAIIGFNINYPDCLLNNGVLLTDSFSLTPPIDGESVLSDSFASLYYWEKHPIKRLNIEVYKPGIYTTVIKLI